MITRNQTSTKIENSFFVDKNRSKSTNNEIEKINNCAKRIFQAIKDFFKQCCHTLVGYAILPSQLSILFLFADLNTKKENLKTQLGGEEIKIPTENEGTTLDGLFFKGDGCEKSDRTMILFNANGIRYEEYGNPKVDLFELNKWQENGWNVVVFNYRGIGKSTGKVSRDGLISDGEAAIEFIKKNYQTPEKLILLHGHSIGGGIAAEVAARYPEVNYCSDRSFSSLSTQIASMFGDLHLMKPNKLENLLKNLGWELNAFDNLSKIKGKKIVIKNQSDGIIVDHLSDRIKMVYNIKLDQWLFENNVEKISMQCNWDYTLTLGAHMRGYSNDENESYFKKINEISL